MLDESLNYDDESCGIPLVANGKAPMERRRLAGISVRDAGGTDMPRETRALQIIFGEFVAEGG